MRQRRALAEEMATFVVCSVRRYGMRGWIITRRRTGMILAVVGVASDISGIARIGPNSTGEARNGRVDCNPIEHVGRRNRRCRGTCRGIRLGARAFGTAGGRRGDRHDSYYRLSHRSAPAAAQAERTLDFKPRPVDRQ